METVQTFNMKDRRVLVLDSALQPVSIVPWQRAFCLLAAGEAHAEKRGKKKPEVLVYSLDGAVIGVKRDIRVPSVIQLGDMIPRWRQRVRFCRKNVIVGRDGCVCQYCDKRFPTERLTLDHVLPRTQKGQTTWENVVTCCTECNQRKAGRTPEQAGMKLKRKPKRPDTVLEVSIRMDKRQMPEEWKDYWDVTLK